MKRFSAFTSIMLCSILFFTAGCYVNHSEPKSGETSEQAAEQAVETEAEKAEKGEKGKFEMSEEVPPAPGDEEFVQKQEQQEPAQKQEQEEPVQKQTQKQSQKQAL